VARLRVYWPTFGLEKQLDGLEKQIAVGFEKQAAGSSILPGGQRVKVTEVKTAFTKTSDYKLIKNQGDRYSLLARGSDDAEHYGFFAENDDDAVEIALDYVARFVVPLQIGKYVYESRQLEKAASEKAPSPGAGKSRL
jgi:hypothetical protein